MQKILKLSISFIVFLTPIYASVTHVGASPALCEVLLNGATWTAKNSSINAGKSGKIKLSGGCAVGDEGSATIEWDGETTNTDYSVGDNDLTVGGKVLRASQKSNGGWTILNTSSPL